MFSECLDGVNYVYISGNALGMIGVSSGIAATVGLLAPTPESFAQMAACVGTGDSTLTNIKKNYFSLLILKYNISFLTSNCWPE